MSDYQHQYLNPAPRRRRHRQHRSLPLILEGEEEGGGQQGMSPPPPTFYTPPDPDSDSAASGRSYTFPASLDMDEDHDDDDEDVVNVTSKLEKFKTTQKSFFSELTRDISSLQFEIEQLKTRNEHLTSQNGALMSMISDMTAKQMQQLRDLSEVAIIKDMTSDPPLPPPEASNYVECGICLENLLHPAAVAKEEEGDEEDDLANADPAEVCATSCGHMYHKYCIRKWLVGKDSCPSCRTTSPPLLPLFPSVGQADVGEQPQANNQKTSGQEFGPFLSRPEVDYDDLSSWDDDHSYDY